MEKTDNFIDERRGGDNKAPSPKKQEEPKPSKSRRFIAWYKENNDNKLFRFVKFLISLGIAYGVRILVYSVWFDHAVFLVNPEWDFWVKTAVIFGAAAGLLVTLDSAMKSEGKTTAWALGLFLFVNCAQHYVKSYYDADGNSKVFVDSSRGYIYLEEESAKFTDIKTSNTGKRYFIHPVSGDTCWNNPPRNLKHCIDENQSINSSYDEPTEFVVYKVDDSGYTFDLKAGEFSKTWFVIQEPVKIWWELESDDYEFLVFTDDGGPGVHGAKNLRLNDHWPVKFYVKALKDQKITLKIWRD